MKKSCGLSLAVWLALVALYGRVAYTKTGEIGPAAAIGFLGGTFAAMLVSSLFGFVTGDADRRALKRAVANEPPADGRLEAASGRIRALERPLEAPFTGRPCVAYEYDVKNRTAGRSDFAGVALAPCAVDGPRGEARLLGWAQLDEFGGAAKEEIDRDRALAYLKSARFEPLGLTGILSTLSSLAADQDGSIRRDFRIGEGEPDLQGRRLSEKILPEGATVTILGIWSEEKRGFAPAGRATLNRVFPVGPSFVLEDLSRNARKTFAMALVFFLALHAILVPMYLLAPGR